jgi:3-deoxy-D-manno-octulosonate cytidylyltransferase
MAKVLGIIPSRLGSNRINQKPLYNVLGLPLIVHVLKRAQLATSLTDLIVATESRLIVDLVEQNGGKAMLTSVNHRNGTERMTEVMDAYPDYDYYTLINGDEILLNPDSIETSINTLINNPGASASMLAIKYYRENSPSDFKIVLNSEKEIMYISRNDIPSSSRNPVEYRLKAYHLMTFKPETLRAYRRMDKSPMEKIEDHEHLRLIENGYKIACEIVNDECLSLDTLDDLPFIEKYLKNDGVYLKYKKD